VRTPEEKWTDHRLDDLNQKRFDRLTFLMLASAAGILGAVIGPNVL
jgi:hypothetical protein